LELSFSNLSSMYTVEQAVTDMMVSSMSRMSAHCHVTATKSIKGEIGLSVGEGVDTVTLI
jgi:hypothetical protein